jgi:hypothetical protein
MEIINDIDLTLDAIVHEAQQIFNEHKPYLEQSFSLKLDGYKISSTTSHCAELQKKARNSKSLLWRIIYRRARRNYQKKVNTDLAYMKNNSKLILINDALMKKLYDEDKQENKDPQHEIASIFVNHFEHQARLTYSILHECFHSLQPMLDGQKKSQKHSLSYNLFYQIFLKKIMDKTVYRIQGIDELSIDEAASDFFAMQYIHAYHKTYSAALSKLDTKGLDELSKARLNLDQIRQNAIKQHAELREKAILQKPDYRIRPYIRFKRIFKEKGYNDVIEAIRNPKLLLHH